MDTREFAAQFRRNADTIRLLASDDVSEEDAHWKPAPNRWSIVEVIGHLYDEERGDFRRRLELTLQDPAKDWPPIDPEAWVTERKYNERSLVESLELFMEERLRSVEWLRDLENPSLDNARTHPVAGEIKAGDLLAAWLAHDFLHMAQLARLRFALVAHDAEPYSTRYAGPPP